MGTFVHGKDLKTLLDAYPYASEFLKDNNEYLISYRFDTGVEIAFDPRTTTKCSLFSEKIPERMRHRLGTIKNYPPNNPSTALSRVSPQLSSANQIFKIDLPSADVARDLVSWLRWA